jgi:hypothetical protein
MHFVYSAKNKKTPDGRRVYRKTKVLVNGKRTLVPGDFVRKWNKKTRRYDYKKMAKRKAAPKKSKKTRRVSKKTKRRTRRQRGGDGTFKILLDWLLDVQKSRKYGMKNGEVLNLNTPKFN